MSGTSPARTGVDPARLSHGHAAGQRRLDRGRARPCRLVAMALTTRLPLGQVLATTAWSASSSWTLAALPLFIWMGEILFRTRLSEEMFRGLVALAAMAARPADPCQRDRLRHLRRGVGLLGRDLRDHRQDRAARARQARLRRGPEPRLARGLRHARPAHPALDPDGGLRGHGERLGAAGVPRRLPARPARDGALLRLHHRLVAAQSREGCRRAIPPMPFRQKLRRIGKAHARACC